MYEVRGLRPAEKGTKKSENYYNTRIHRFTLLRLLNAFATGTIDLKVLQRICDDPANPRHPREMESFRNSIFVEHLLSMTGHVIL